MPILKPEPDLHPAELFAQPGVAPWWVAHSRSRREKALARYLREHEVAYYLPQAPKPVRRAGRERTSYLPLFAGYAFFVGGFEERRVALQSHLLAGVLTVDDRPRLHEQLANLRRLQEAGMPIVPHPYLAPGDPVEVIDGPFAGWTGKILREKTGLRLVVEISFLRRAVAADLPRDIVAPLRPIAGRVASARS